MNKRNWKIIYSDYSGMEKKAIELISTEMGRHLNRDKGVFTIHVLACENEQTNIDCNAVIIGRYDSSGLISKYVDKNEIPKDGYVVKVIDNPDNPDLKLCIIAGDTKKSVFYGAVEFADDYFASASPWHGALRMYDEIFMQEKLPDYYNASSPKFKTRSIFTWGQPINDYRNYIEKMARLKLNQVIIWNDFIPLNANEIVDYAHEYGIEVIWGYAWGWSAEPNKKDYLKNVMSNIKELKDSVIKEYKEKYSKVKGDGIYFQSFTEHSTDTLDGKIIAEVVTDFVNETADELLKLYPNLHIQFGLHASSVKNKMEYIKKVDERVEILWEDCGTFPYNYNPAIRDENAFLETCAFTEEMIKLRKVNPLGLVYKGQMTMDWTRFAHQSGAYVMGKESRYIINHDIEMMKPIWKTFQAEWIRYGKYAYEMTNKVLEMTDGDVNMNLAGTLTGGIWFPFALTAQLFWDCTIEYEELLEKVLKRQSVSMA